jgi:hypothetical protein
MRGYVPQWRLGTRLIYAGLASGNLRWVGLADPSAGSFDDVVLGYSDHIVGYQLKTSRDEGEFRLKTLLIGEEALWSKIVESSKALKTANPGMQIKLCFGTDARPSTADNLGTEARPVSSAAFLRALEANGATWTFQQWVESPYAPFFNDLRLASGLDDAELQDLWRNLSFLTSGSARAEGLAPVTNFDSQRQEALFGLLPRLVSEADNTKTRWTEDDLYKALRWRNAFGQRHSHVFPVDLLVQGNPQTEDALRLALDQAESGYIALIGPPGSGKSTLLQAGMLPTPRAVFIRYLAFVPDEGHGLGRAEAADFLMDMIVQLKKQGLGHNVMPGSELPELRAQLEGLLHEAGARYIKDTIRTVVIVDGLDHIPREERPQHSLLKQLPLPHALPRGVLFILGSQRVDLDDIPPTVRDQAGAAGRCIKIAPLQKEAVHRLARASSLPDDVDRDQLWQKSEGHPLSVRYLVERLLRLQTPEQRRQWLTEAEDIQGNIDLFYERVWHDIENNVEAQKVLGYLALAEGALDPARLDEVVGDVATDAAFEACSHLLKINSHGRWAIFHNSFRLFLLEKTRKRFGRTDDNRLKERYIALADLARKSAPDDPQRWLELRYLARAGEDAAVLAGANAANFHAQFKDGRSPSDIQADIRFAFGVVRRTKDAAKLFDLILCRNEIEMTTDAVSDEILIKACVEAGLLDQAISIIEAGDLSLNAHAPYRVIDALLAAGRLDDARRLFEAAEPIDKLLGSVPLDQTLRDDNVGEWAHRVLIFREPRHLLAALDRMYVAEHAFRSDPGSLERFKNGLKLSAVRMYVDDNPSADIPALCDGVGLTGIGPSVLRALAVESAYNHEEEALTAKLLAQAMADNSQLGNGMRQRLAAIAVRLNDAATAASAIEGIAPPTFDRNTLTGLDQIKDRARDVFQFNLIEAYIGREPASREYADKGLLKGFQLHLENLARMVGSGRAGHKMAPEAVWSEICKVLTFVARGKTQDDHASDDWYIERALPFVADAILQAAHAHGPEAIALTIQNVDKMMASNAGRLSRDSFRRAFALSAFYADKDYEKALTRLPAPYGLEAHGSPSEYVVDMCELAIANARIGNQEGARTLLQEMNNNILGISRPPRKDAQYAMWEDLLEHANKEDPDHREERVRFAAQLTSGMSETEGRGAARRMARTYLTEAGQCSPALADSAMHQADGDHLANWPTILAAALKGIVKRRADLVPAALRVFDNMVLPVMDELADSIYEPLFDAMPPDLRESEFEESVVRVSVDGESTLKDDLITQLGEIARKHKVTLTLPAITPVAERPKRSRSTQDVVFDQATSLEELETQLSAEHDDKQSHNAVRAFERLTERGSYELVKRLIQDVRLKNDSRAQFAAARAAVRAGDLDAARSYLPDLQAAAERDGSWGAWQSGAKLRLHRLLAELEGAPAKERAFDAFSNDLSQGREWTISLIPDIASVFEVAVPGVSWTKMWDVLEDHLKQYRDFRTGKELPFQENPPATDEDLIAAWLCSAVDLMTSSLTHQVRLTAMSLTAHEKGEGIVANLIRRLWAKGGEHALEGSRIAWENRDRRGLADLIVELIPQMAASGDIGIIRYGQTLAREYSHSFAVPSAELSSFYQLGFPDSPGIDVYEPPPGFSPTFRGMWSEDPIAWTWPLESAVRVLSDATGYPPEILRRRAGELMRRDGGGALFGPEPTKAQHDRLTRLELKMHFRRLEVVAAFRAAREVAAEFAAAGEFDWRSLDLVALKTGAASLGITTIAPAPRPLAIARPTIVRSMWPKDAIAWLNDETIQSAWPEASEHIILASASSFESTSIRESHTEEALMLHSGKGFKATNLHQALWDLPTAVVLDQVFPLYDALSPTGIAFLDGGVASSVPDNAIVFCPRLAAKLGLSSDPTDPWTYHDDNSEIVVKSLWWRDGGLKRIDIDRAMAGTGFVVSVAAKLWPRIAPLIETKKLMQIWRSETRDGERLHGKFPNGRIVLAPDPVG